MQAECGIEMINASTSDHSKLQKHGERARRKLEMQQKRRMVRKAMLICKRLKKERKEKEFTQIKRRWCIF